LQTNELYQLASVAFCLLVAWVWIICLFSIYLQLLISLHYTFMSTPIIARYISFGFLFVYRNQTVALKELYLEHLNQWIAMLHVALNVWGVSLWWRSLVLELSSWIEVVYQEMLHDIWNYWYAMYWNHN